MCARLARGLNASTATVTNTAGRSGDVSPSAVEQPLRLLIVDDDPNYRAYIAALTRRLGFWVDAAPDGDSALQRLAQGAYDIALIDLEMPGSSGLATIARIRAEPALATLYAIMITGHEDLDTKLMALDAGFDDFLAKSSSERELVAKLVAGRRLASRQRTMSVAVRDLYGLATRDDLTGAFNRRFFISETERLLAEGKIVNLVLLDVDDFKIINDTYGHLAGDNVLRDIATSLHSNTRADDIVARFGGDEFVVAVPYLDVSAVERIAERLAQAIAALEWRFDRSFRIGVSAGFASSRLLDKPALAQLVNAADRDMYKNKWMRKHPDLRPELYEYPAQERNVVDWLLEGERKK